MSDLKVNIKRLDPTLPLPKYETKGSVGFDFYASKDVVIYPNQIQLIPTNLIIEVPKGYMLAVFSRSSTPRKKGLLKPHAVGIIDQDYCGQTDEIMLQVYNFTQAPVHINKLDRIAQGIFIPILKAEFQEFTPESSSRGGFGSTG